MIEQNPNTETNVSDITNLENTFKAESIEDIANIRELSGFWRRIFALMIDIILLVVVGYLLGAILGSNAYNLGNWGVFIGLVVAVMYFGILNSEVGNGQTLGKKLLDIQVVNQEGQTIVLHRSLQRAVILIVPFFLDEFYLSQTFQKSSIYISFVVFSICFGFLYFYMFNRNTRQSIHDILIGTYVVNKKPEGIVNRPKIWKGHYKILVVVILALLIIISRIILPFFNANFDVTEVELLQNKLGEIEGILLVSVMETYSYGSQAINKSLNIHVLKKGHPSNNQEVLHEVAELVLDNYNNLEQKDFIYITVSYQYNFVFFKKSESFYQEIKQN